MRAPRVASRRDKAALFALVASLYLLAASGQPWVEADPQLARARLLLENGTLASERPIYPADVRGPDGRFYERHGLANTLLHLPVAATLPALERVVPGRSAQLLSFLGALTGALVTAGTVLLFLVLLGHLGTDRRDALVAALALAFLTLLFPYSSNNYEGNLEGLLLTAALLAWVRFRERGRGRLLFLAGLASGLALLARELALPMVAALGVAVLWRRGDRLHRAAVWAAGLAAPLGLGATYNHLRTGNPLLSPVLLDSLSGDGKLELAHAPASGLAHLLLSPGGSILAYSPILLVVLPYFGRLARRHPEVSAIALAFATAVLTIVARLPEWFGLAGWGPRYTLALLPFLMLPAGTLAAELRSIERRGLRVGVAVIAAWSLLIQLAGVLTNWHGRLPGVLARSGYALGAPWNRMFWRPAESQWWDAVATLGGNLTSLLTGAEPPATGYRPDLSAASLYASRRLFTWWTRLLGEGIGPAFVAPALLALLLVAALSAWLLFRPHEGEIGAEA